MKYKTPTDLMLRIAVYFSAWVSLWFVFGATKRFTGRVYDTLRKVDHFMPGEWRIRAYGILLIAVSAIAIYAFIRHIANVLENCLMLLGIWWLYFGLVSTVQLLVYSDGPPIAAGWGIFTAIAYYTLARRVALGQ